MSGVNEREAAMLLLQGSAQASAQAGMRAAIAAGVLAALMGGRRYDKAGNDLDDGEFLSAKVELAVKAADKLIAALRSPPDTRPVF